MNENISARLPLDSNLTRGPKVTISVNGEKVKAHIGETVAAVLLVENLYAMRTTIAGEPRGVFCGMGICFDCLVVVNGIPNTRACMTWVTDAMVISTQDGLSPSNQ
jgi:aerobic-type carbon monoxide dehydrogenase small subunit (CoxS/CutS family)